VTNHTIFALSSGSPPAGVSVIRVSGPAAHDAGRQLAGSLPDARTAAVRALRDAGGALLDEALVLRFDARASATGEDVVEFHCHGGRAVVAAVSAALRAVEGLREARPGEFTRRAFENGRIDLTEAEGLADLLIAETESQRRAALSLADGGLRKQIEKWQAQLLQLSARAEAAIDYVDEDGADDGNGLVGECNALARELDAWLARPPLQPLRDGVLVVIAGPPNSGKSSLLNAIVGYERAIVTEIPGTTRDHIEVPIAISGVPLRLVDTAGVREAHDRVEELGIERARRLIGAGDILLWLGEPEGTPDHPRSILVHGRADLPERANTPRGSLRVSSKTGEGLPSLTQCILKEAANLLPREGEVALNERQLRCLEEACAALAQVAAAPDLVLTAESLRGARLAFDRLTGRAGVEDLLDAVFGRFCLGK
jgi:tRNA modification GTPase